MRAEHLHDKDEKATNRILDIYWILIHGGGRNAVENKHHQQAVENSRPKLSNRYLWFTF